MASAAGDVRPLASPGYILVSEVGCKCEIVALNVNIIFGKKQERLAV